jgi:hypothetical protein
MAQSWSDVLKGLLQVVKVFAGKASHLSLGLAMRLRKTSYWQYISASLYLAEPAAPHIKD